MKSENVVPFPRFDKDIKSHIHPFEEKIYQTLIDYYYNKGINRFKDIPPKERMKLLSELVLVNDEYLSPSQSMLYLSVIHSDALLRSNCTENSYDQEDFLMNNLLVKDISRRIEDLTICAYNFFGPKIDEFFVYIESQKLNLNQILTKH